MKNNFIEIKTSLIGKAFFVFLILLAVAFFFGIYIGKETIPNPLDYSIDDNFKEQLNSCSEQVQRLSLKFTTLKSYAIKRGILDEKGQKIAPKKIEQKPKTEIVATKLKMDKKWTKKEKKKINSKKIENKTAKNKENSILKKKIAEKKPKESRRISKKELKKEIKKDLWSSIEDAAKQNVVNKKNSKPSPVGKCNFSIQLFSGTSKSQAMNAQRIIPVKKTRIVEGIVRGSKWFRIRFGCFDSKDDVVKAIDKMKKKFPSIKNPTIVKGY